MSSSSSDSMAFDGSSSDIARQLYHRAKANDVVDQLTLNAVPDAVLSRLADLELDWGKLPGLAQLAVLWDSGFGITSTDSAVQFWTLADHTMADLALTVYEFEDAGCIAMNCTEPSGSLSFSSLFCNGYQMGNASKCVVEDFEDDTTYHASMWAIGGNPSTAPVPRVAKHAWNDQNVSYVVMAVHAVSLANEPSYGECPSDSENGGYGSVAFPCYRTSDITDEIKAEMQVVTGSDWVSQWLVEDYPEAAIDPASGFNLLLLIPIILGSLAVLALVGVGVYCMRKRRQSTKKAAEDQVESPAPYHSSKPSPPTSSDHRSSSDPRPTLPVSDDFTDLTIQFPHGLSHEYGSNSTLKVLLGSKFLAGKRVPVETLSFTKVLSKGASGEVWLCEYAGQQVAAKRLLQTGKHTAEDVHEFAEEIELNASLEHPNISRFIGVSWNSLSNLAMVTEYFPRGDLKQYLQSSGDLLSWAKVKIHMAVGIAHALEYLHGRSPPIIHRDLKSRNILLTQQLEAKVIDFGVSRGRLDNTMTAGVGTPYWTAPEVLEGRRYTEQADIYSFGVVMSELDTSKIPFFDVVTAEGKKEKPFRILQRVMSGTLRPSFSKDCPPRIRRVGAACCQHDPAQRPSASTLVRMLQGE